MSLRFFFQSSRLVRSLTVGWAAASFRLRGISEKYSQSISSRLNRDWARSKRSFSRSPQLPQRSRFFHFRGNLALWLILGYRKEEEELELASDDEDASMETGARAEGSPASAGIGCALPPRKGATALRSSLLLVPEKRSRTR